MITIKKIHIPRFNQPKRTVFYNHHFIRNNNIRIPTVKTKSLELDTLNTTTYYIGKSIILFTMFYCTMNWWHYKKIREDSENKKDK